jgi:hypothetical protein
VINQPCPECDWQPTNGGHAPGCPESGIILPPDPEPRVVIDNGNLAVWTTSSHEITANAAERTVRVLPEPADIEALPDNVKIAMRAAHMWIRRGRMPPGTPINGDPQPVVADDEITAVRKAVASKLVQMAIDVSDSPIENRWHLDELARDADALHHKIKMASWQ